MGWSRRRSITPRGRPSLSHSEGMWRAAQRAFTRPGAARCMRRRVGMIDSLRPETASHWLGAKLAGDGANPIRGHGATAEAGLGTWLQCHCTAGTGEATGASDSGGVRAEVGEWGLLGM